MLYHWIITFHPGGNIITTPKGKDKGKADGKATAKGKAKHGGQAQA